MTQEQSPFDRRAYAYIERGYSVIPIAPGTKRPGQWSEADGWRGMHDWERFSQRLPTEIEIGHWEKWPDAGIGLLTGKLSGVVALDRDYDAPGTDALERLIPYTPVKKKGAKGYTAFFRFNGEKSCSFNIGGARVLDVLSDGRQTLMPGTKHPEGHTYIYLTEDLLEDYDPKDLPALPDDFLEQVARTLEPYQTQEDKKYQKKQTAPTDSTDHINTDLSIQAEYFRDLNRQALMRLDEWVTRIVPLTKTERDGFRTVATWRGAKNPNVGVHPSGIFDFGGNYGMTPIDLVMYANGLTFQKAAEALRACLALNEPEPIRMTVGGASAAAAGQPTPPPVKASPALLPWQKPAIQPPPPVMLPPTTSDAPAKAIPTFITDPPGVIGDVSRWITATAPKAQPELAVAAAIALAATVTQRIYRSNLANFTSMYMVMVAKSTEGKEHPQSCVERVLTAAGLTSLVAGSGYTASGAVFSALLRQPSHIAIIDEMGKLLKLSRAKGNANSEAAIDKLVEAFGKLNGVMRPPVYSTMTLTKTQAAGSQPSERVIHNPAISILGATTPATFYGNLTDDLVQDGFLGRLIVVESSQPRQLARFVDQTDPPERIVEWCKAVHAPSQRQGNLAEVSLAEMPATTVAMTIGAECEDLMRAFEVELNELKDQFEPEHLDVLLGRTFEKALRLSMIACKACNPDALVVKIEHLQWAINYVRHYDMALVRAVRRNRIVNQTDTDIKKAVDYIKGARHFAGDPKNAKYAMVLQAGAMPHAMLLKKMHMKTREFSDLINTAIEAGIISKSPGVQFNYAGDVYFAGDTE